MCKNITYTLTHATGSSVNVNDVIYAKDKLTLKVTLTYKDTTLASELATQDVSISNLGITIDFEQSSDALVNETTGEVVNNRVYHIGDKITLNNEDYWVIENSGADKDYVVALKDTTTTGNVSQTGSSYDESSLKTTVNDWANTNFINNELKEVNGYKARLITYDEYNDISSSTWKNGRYWTMTKNGYWCGIDENGVRCIYQSGLPYMPVRPVINVYKSALETNNNE